MNKERIRDWIDSLYAVLYNYHEMTDERRLDLEDLVAKLEMLNELFT